MMRPSSRQRDAGVRALTHAQAAGVRGRGYAMLRCYTKCGFQLHGTAMRCVRILSSHRSVRTAAGEHRAVQHILRLFWINFNRLHTDTPRSATIGTT